MKRKITIAVSGLNAIDSPGPGVPVIRALKDSRHFDVRVIGLAYDTLEPGIFMHDLVDKTYQLPLPTAGIEMLYKRLQYIHKKEKLDLIIPNFDSEIYNFINLSETLRSKLGIRCYLPTLEQFEARQKSNLFEFGKKYGIQVPRSLTVNSIKELTSLKEEIKYPFVLKGKFCDAYTVYSQEQAANIFNRISAKWGLPVIAQEFIRGQELNVTALGDGEGNTIGAVAMRKQYITEKGKAWSGISIMDEKLLSISQNMISASKWRGGCELEMIKTDDDKYYLLEINPRFPAWIYLAVACGQNHAEALVQLALEEKIEPMKRYEAGKLFVRYSYDMIVDLKEFEKISTVGEL
jgi:carbamoyl-phosphate synthase large subunit